MPERTKAPRQSWYAMAFLWMIFALNANGRELTNRVLPGIVDTFGITADTAGLMGTVSAIGMALCSLPLAKWADNGGRGWKRKYRVLVVSGGYLVFLLCNGLTPLTGTFTMVLVWQFLRGAFSGPGEACEVGTVAEWWPKEKNGFALGLHHAAYPWGTALGGVMVVLLLSVVGMENWRYAYIVFPAIGLVTLTLYWKWSNAQNYAEFQEETVKRGMSVPIRNVDHAEEQKEARKGSLGRALKNPNILVVSIAACLSNFAFIALMFWMTPYLTFCAGYSATAAAGLSVVYAITGGIGQVVWGVLADKFGAKRTLVICCAWLVVAYYLMRYINVSLGALVGMQLLFGCCSNAVYPIFYKFVADSSEEGTVVTGNGIMTMMMFCGSAVATGLIGVLIQLGGGWTSSAGYMTGLYVMSGSMLASLLLVIFFTRETNGPNFRKDFSLVSLESCNLK